MMKYKLVWNLWIKTLVYERFHQSQTLKERKGEISLNSLVGEIWGPAILLDEG